MPFKIILQRLKYPENLGLIARAAQAFGFTDIRLVAPQFNLDRSSPAYKTACGAHEILNKTNEYDTLDQALKDLHYVAGFSRRIHGFKRPFLDLQPWLENEIQAKTQQKVGLLFGSEDYGLLTEEKQQCHCLVNIPLHYPTLSLNVSQAVTVVLYELFKISISPAEIPIDDPPATINDINRVYSESIALLEQTPFFKPERRHQQVEIIRCLIQRLNLSQKEYQTMMGILNAIKKG